VDEFKNSEKKEVKEAERNLTALRRVSEFNLETINTILDPNELLKLENFDLDQFKFNQNKEMKFQFEKLDILELNHNLKRHYPIKSLLNLNTEV
jgi:hypothetical protein